MAFLDSIDSKVWSRFSTVETSRMMWTWAIVWILTSQILKDWWLARLLFYFILQTNSQFVLQDWAARRAYRPKANCVTSCPSFALLQREYEALFCRHTFAKLTQADIFLYITFTTAPWTTCKKWQSRLSTCFHMKKCSASRATCINFLPGGDKRRSNETSGGHKAPMYTANLAVAKSEAPINQWLVSLCFHVNVTCHFSVVLTN